MRDLKAIKKVVIHHSLTEQDDVDKLITSMNRTHKQRMGQPADANGSTCSYHWTIGTKGEKRKTRQIKSVGYANSDREVNKESINIVLSGNLDKHPPTKAQYQSLAELIIETNIAFPGITWHEHNEWANRKTCAGEMFDINLVMAMVDEMVKPKKLIVEKKHRVLNYICKKFIPNIDDSIIKKNLIQISNRISGK